VKPSYAKRRQLKLTAEEAYKILGYLSAKVISKLKEGVNSVKVKEGTKALTWQNCTTYIKAKLYKFIS
jgi:hypothetical protein